MKPIEYEEVKLLKQSEKSTVFLMREPDGERLFVQKTLEGRHPVYAELLDSPHPYLPKLYEARISDDETTVIEEYIEGRTLGSVSLSEPQIRKAIKELCAVLEFLHGKGIIHRDVKPSNIILAGDGHIRLIDFDAARMIKEGVEQDTALLGTRGYAPPEQYGFSQTDARADVYALGMTLEQLLGGKAGKPRYRRVIRTCTDLNPDKRYQSAREVRAALSPAKRIAVCSVVAILLAVVLCYAVLRPQPLLPGASGDGNGDGVAGVELTALPAPGNPHWDAETGIALWDNVLESGSGGSPAYSWRLYRFDTATPPSPDDDTWIMRGNMYGSGNSRGSIYNVNLSRHLEANGFYYFSASAEGDGENYANSPFAVSDAFEFTGENAPLLPAPTDLQWDVETNEGESQYYATWGNFGEYLSTDSFEVVVYDESGGEVMNNDWSKAEIEEMGLSGIWLSPEGLAAASGKVRFTVQAFTSRPNEWRSSVIPDPMPEEFFSPWLTIGEAEVSGEDEEDAAPLSSPAVESMLSPLVETIDGEYIIMREEAADQGETTRMQVDMTGNGDLMEFVISLRQEELFADGSAVTPDGSVSPLWTRNADLRLYEVPHETYQLTDVPCLIQLTCVDLDYDGVKEVLVSKGNQMHTLITEVWRYTGGGEEPFSYAGFAWGVESMSVTESHAINVPLGDMLGDNLYIYEHGEVSMVSGNDFNVFKEYQDFEYGDVGGDDIAYILANGGTPYPDDYVDQNEVFNELFPVDDWPD